VNPKQPIRALIRPNSTGTTQQHLHKQKKDCQRTDCAGSGETAGGSRVEILRSSSLKLSIGIDNGAYNLEQLDMHQHYLVGTI
jgi:hypothetical protein